MRGRGLSFNFTKTNKLYVFFFLSLSYSLKIKVSSLNNVRRFKMHVYSKKTPYTTHTYYLVQIVHTMLYSITVDSAVNKIGYLVLTAEVK